MKEVSGTGVRARGRRALRSRRRAVAATVAVTAAMVLALALVLARPAVVSAAGAASSAVGQPIEPSDALDSSLKSIEESGATAPIDRVFQDISRGGEISWKDILEDILTGKGLDLGRLGKAFAGSVAADLLVSSKVLGKIMLIGVVIACLQILTETIAPGGSSGIALWASHLALVVLAVLSFNEVLRIARDAMATLQAAFFAFIPALTSLSLVSGAPVTAAVLHPLVFGMGTLVSVFVVDVAFPMIYTSIALNMAGDLGGGDRASGVAAMLRQAAFAGTGVLMACFVGIVVGQRAAAGFADGMAYRTARYLSSTFIPVAGRLIGDSMDMFFLSAYSLRGALGIVGAIALLGAVFSPVLQILSCLFVWKIASSVLGPLCGNDVHRSIKSMSDGIALIAMSTFVTCFCFVICVSLVAHAVRPF